MSFQVKYFLLTAEVHRPGPAGKVFSQPPKGSGTQEGRAFKARASFVVEGLGFRV